MTLSPSSSSFVITFLSDQLLVAATEYVNSTALLIYTIPLSVWPVQVQPAEPERAADQVRGGAVRGGDDAQAGAGDRAEVLRRAEDRPRAAAGAVSGCGYTHVVLILA